MLSFHVSHKAHLTVAVRKYDVPVPFGVVECSEFEVRRITEKPVYQFLVNAGIYLLEPEALDYIPAGRRFDMTDLIEALLADKTRRVVSFPILEYWLDIGKPGDYEQAQRDVVGWEQKT
jgi:NDP-sugar pyrophosphorylase family protein